MIHKILLYAFGCALCIFGAALAFLHFGTQCWVSNDEAAIVMGLIVDGGLFCVLMTVAILLFRKAIR